VRKIKLFSLLLIMMMTNAWAINWSYSSGAGPRYWGLLTPEFSTCGHGRQQSPINLTHAVPLQDGHLSVHYRNSAFTLRQSPHNLYQDNTKLTKNYLVYNGQRYNLVEIHFHVPSEHRLNGYQYPMEAHLVHQNSQHQILVLGIFLKTGRDNDYLAALLSSPQFKTLDEEIERPVELNPLKLNPTGLLAQVKQYYVYDGSLTTPPCAEGVKWIVAKTPVELSEEQLKAFKAQITPFNSRPLQPLDGRVVQFKS